MSSFRVGQVVVCINAKGPPAEEVGELPREGGVYTVREIRPWHDGVGLLLAEIVNPSFHSRRFRPAKETSLDVFAAMLASPDLDLAEA